MIRERNPITGKLVPPMTPKRLEKLEAVWRLEMRKHMAGHGSEWIRFGGDKLPISHVGYLITHWREVFSNKNR